MSEDDHDALAMKIVMAEAEASKHRGQVELRRLRSIVLDLVCSRNPGLSPERSKFYADRAGAAAMKWSIDNESYFIEPTTTLQAVVGPQTVGG